MNYLRRIDWGGRKRGKDPWLKPLRIGLTWFTPSGSISRRENGLVENIAPPSDFSESVTSPSGSTLCFLPSATCMVAISPCSCSAWDIASSFRGTEEIAPHLYQREEVNCPYSGPARDGAHKDHVLLSDIWSGRPGSEHDWGDYTLWFPSATALSHVWFHLFD